jgi:hypothetical protein
MDPDWEHAFYWDLGDDNKAKAQSTYQEAHELL